MIDLRHPLAVLAGRLPWSQTEAALAPAFERTNRLGQVVEIDVKWYPKTGQVVKLWQNRKGVK